VIFAKFTGARMKRSGEEEKLRGKRSLGVLKVQDLEKRVIGLGRGKKEAGYLLPEEIRGVGGFTERERSATGGGGITEVTSLKD